MGLDGPFCDCEPVGDFLVAGSRRDQGHDLGLARGEPVECRGRPMRRQAEVFRLTELLKHTCQEFLQPSDQSTGWPDRKSTRLNSSHLVIPYAVFCLKKKKNDDSPLNAYPRTLIAACEAYNS